MSKTRYTIKLPGPGLVVIDTSEYEENSHLPLVDWVWRTKRGDSSMPREYMFKWYHADNVNARVRLYGTFTCRRGGTVSVNLWVSDYPAYCCTLGEFMNLLRIGRQGWCISSLVNVL